MSAVIEVENVSKRYLIYGAYKHHGRSMREVLTRKFRHYLYSVSPFHTPQLEIKVHLALSDVSFKIRKGEKVAIMGNNGSGKTTLLRILSRITAPSSGSVKIDGEVSSLLQAGTGFHQELSGRENIFMNGIILGMTKYQIKRKFDEIVEFSGVRDFIDVPIKYYSTGMQSRLGFSVAAHLNSEIMIIDEGLANGDSAFQQKCIQKIRDLSIQGRTIMFVSHDEKIVKGVCTRAITLDKGRIAEDSNDY